MITKDNTCNEGYTGYTIKAVGEIKRVIELCYDITCFLGM